MQVTDLPALNASLNALATVLLTLGWLFIKRGEVAKHRACMIGALATSVAFLTSYVIYHYHAGSKPFPHEGPIRVVYFAILITHVILAAVIVVPVLLTASRALRSQFDRHRAIARWTLPLWLYVSVTGVIVYWMLYRM